MKRKQLLSLIILMAAAIAQQAWAGDKKGLNGQNIVHGICYQLTAKKQVATVIRHPQGYQGEVIIPEKVTVDEYIELSKEFSSERSRLFINGILDKIVVELRSKGRINKSGRGLLEN